MKWSEPGHTFGLSALIRKRVDMIEHSVLSELRAGSSRAFDTVYAAYRLPLFNFLTRLCQQRSLAEDLFQNTWLKLARSASQLRPDTDLKAWLFRVARNEYRSYRRWQRVDFRRLLAAGREDARAVGPVDLDTARAVDRCLARVSAPERELLLLISVEGLEPRAAAAILGVSQVALRKRLARARAHLAGLMAELES